MILEIIDGINCRVTDIQDGDLVPVGGSTLNSRFSKFVNLRDFLKKWQEMLRGWQKI